MTDKPDEIILKLNDSFNEKHKEDADIEVRVRMLNVNYGRSKGLMEKCKPLSEYSWFVAEIRTNHKSHSIEASVKMAIETMPDDYLIKRFLIGHHKEVEGMLDREYNEAEVKELFYEDGRAEGRAEGEDRKLIKQICCKLRKGKSISQIADELEEDEVRIKAICDAAEKYAPDYDENKVIPAVEAIEVAV